MPFAKTFIETSITHGTATDDQMTDDLLVNVGSR